MVAANDLDRHLVAQEDPPSLVDGSHAAFRQQRQDLVALVEELARGEHGAIKSHRDGPHPLGVEPRLCYLLPMLPLLVALLLLIPQPAAPVASCANVWQGHANEYEDFLRKATVEKVVALPIGVTRPQRAHLAPGGLAASFAWKPLRPGVQQGYFESYKSEIAAYELDKILQLNMVPVVVERKVDHESGAAVLWLDGVRSWESVLPLPKPPTWDQQIARMKMLDDLIGNSDRNKGNLLVDADWHIFLIDHSRAFVTDNKLPQELQTVDRRLWERMQALDAASLKTALGTWLDGRQIQALLKRRDAMQKKIDALAAKYGERAFF
jgi:hypothetical protein